MKITIFIYKYLSDYNLGSLYFFFVLFFLLKLCVICLNRGAFERTNRTRITRECGEIEENNKIKMKHTAYREMLHKRLLDAFEMDFTLRLLWHKTINTHSFGRLRLISTVPHTQRERKKEPKLNLQAAIRCSCICLLSKNDGKNRREYGNEKKKVNDII